MKKEMSKHLNVKNNLTIYIIIFVIISFISFILVIGGSNTGGGGFINIINPLNGTISLDGNIIFSYNVTNSTQISNCSLIFDGIINQTNTNITDLETQYFYLYNLDDGDYNWGVNCTDSDGNETISETRNFEVFIDITPPTVTLNGPADGSTDTDGNVMFNYTITDDEWVTNCSLYTNINGIWQIKQTNVFVQKDFPIYFEVDDFPDGITFNWNILCYDFALNPNYGWGSSNRTLIINNSAPRLSTYILNQNWQEDNYTILNLSNYFIDNDGDILIYNSTTPENINIIMDGSKATLKSDKNWYGIRSIKFYAFDPLGKNASSNTVTLTVNEAGDTPPNYISTLPIDNYNDTDGFITFNCSATDDYDLNNVSLYTDTTGTWKINQTKELSGLTDSTTFDLSNLIEGSYKWACKFYDNNSQSSWSENRTFNVNIIAELDDDISNFTINHIDHNRTILVSYSNYLDDALFLGDLTIYLSNGSIYFTKNMSDSQKFETNSTDPPLNVYAEKIRIKYDEIFYGDFTVGNEEWINITLKYSHLGNTYFISKKHIIEVKSSLSTP